MSVQCRSFTGDHLRAVAFPLGGLGTGTFSLGGRGQLQDWEIFNRPGKGRVLPYTFFSIWAQPEGGEPVARIAERRLQPPFVDGRGLPPGRVCGLPRLAEATFRGEYPFAWIDFEDAGLPVELSLRAWNPLIPHDAENSGIPGAIFDWTIRNPGAVAVEATLALSLFNAAGYDGKAALASRRHPQFGGNWNEWVEEGELRGLRMSTAKYESHHPQYGSLALLTDSRQTTHLLHWERAGWFDDLQGFWDDFRTDGLLEGPIEPSATSDRETDVGTLGLRVRLDPGQQQTVSFYLAWSFPNLENYWNSAPPHQGSRLGNYYATRWPDAWAAARELAEHRSRLERGTAEYHAALHSSTLPPEVLDAVSSQVSILRSTTCLRTADGMFHAFEGCNDDSGCCPMNCTHVWNYEQALAFLFPELERSMRLTDFGVNTRDDGRMAFRTLLPLTADSLWGGPPAADGQMGSVLKLYREWQLCGDRGWMLSLWPHARRALEFAWVKWDADGDGVMEGEQHNTYDIEFYGPNSMMGTLYLGALRAAAVMAREAGESDFAAACDHLFAVGRLRLDELLWNGEYYVQLLVPPSEPAEGLPGMQSVQTDGEVRYQYESGCLSDQLLGQWFARVVGLGALLPPEHIRGALASVFRHNFRRELSTHESCQRTYALNDEGGLLLCSWPNGGRPRFPFPYADEVWTGIEYQVAAHMVYEGLQEEGVEIVRTLRARHDGLRRNPWDEFECGHHYARALASWSLLTAFSGFEYSAPEGSLRFRPRIAGDCSFFWATGTGWGSYSRTGNDHLLTVRHGIIALASFDVPGEPVDVTLGASDLLDPSLDRAALNFPEGPILVLKAGDWLQVETSGD